MKNATFLKKSNLMLIALFVGMPLLAAQEEPIQYCLDRSSGVHFDGPRMVVVNRVPILITGDRKALNTAFIRAELKAKGILTRFLAEKHSSSLTNVDTIEDVTGSRQLTDADGNLTTTEISSMQKETLTSLENNVTSAHFVGLRKFEEFYSDELGEVCISVGVDQETVNKVNSFKEMMGNSNQVEMKESKTKSGLPIKSFHRRSVWK